MVWADFDDGSPSGFKAFVVCRHDYGSSPVIFFLAMRGLTLIKWPSVPRPSEE
jgi:hypothetical protein